MSSDPCSFSKPSECVCTHISWFVDILFAKQILDCRVELEFDVKKNGVRNLVRRAVFICLVTLYFLLLNRHILTEEIKILPQ